MAASKKGAPPQIPGLVFVQPLGSGGYADVFLYEQQSPRMPVAVKVLKSEGLTDAMRAQFVDEADTMAELGDHPYIVQVFRSGTSDDGRPYLVMKYYPPPNLAMRARAEQFSVEEVLRTGIQLASAVETAHRAHITHRDIKPANVLVSAYGAPGLTDFGIAGRGRGEMDPGEDVGVSVPWAAPEVLYGQSNGDERSDVYSLAATLWQLLVGRSPFEVPGGDNSAYALMPRIRSQAVPSTGRRDVPAGLERLLGQAMAKDPTHRPVSALEFARALQAVEQNQRLARTPIVVLDEQGHTTLVSQTQGSPTGGGGVDEDRTRIKAPQQVLSAQAPEAPPVSLPDDDTRRRPLSSPAARVAPGSTAPSYAAGPASGRASPPGAAPAYTAPRHDAGSAYDRTSPPQSAASVLDDVTVRRAPSTPASGVEAPVRHAAPAPAGPSPALLWGLAAGVVVLLGVVLFLVFRPDGAEPVEATPSPTISLTDDNSAIGNGVFDPPTLVAEPGPGSVSFRWTYADMAKGDSYHLLIASDRNKIREDTPEVVKVTTKTVKVPKGTQVCASVIVNRNGTQSPPSQPGCETAL